MKILLTTITLLLTINCQAGHHWKFQEHEVIQTSYQFKHVSSDNTLFVHNINGSIEVQGYDGDEIRVDIDKTLMAKTQEKLQLAKKETWFKVINENNELHMFMKTPYSRLTLEDGEYQFHENNSSQKYQYKMDYKIKVPRDLNLTVITVNDGNIRINDVQAKRISAKNINGEISLDQVSGEMDIMTVNGDIALNYLDKNIDSGHFKSVNGTFDIRFTEKPDIEITYKTLNGHLFTAFDPSDVSSFVHKQYKGKKRGIKYKIKSNKVVRIGNGTHKFYFKTINGDIKIAKKV